MCSSVIPDAHGLIQIAVKPVSQQQQLEHLANDGILSSRTASLVMGGLYTGPYFDPYTPTDIFVQVGSNALLPCRVRQAGNRSVSLPFSLDDNGHKKSKYHANNMAGISQGLLPILLPSNMPLIFAMLVIFFPNWMSSSRYL